jgi:hypothetical protein
MDAILLRIFIGEDEQGGTFAALRSDCSRRATCI